MMVSRYKVDEDDRLQHLLWADGQCRMDYECFGDVLSFDATYKVNKYEKPLVVFTGVNNHAQTVVFACGPVGDETEETYTWLLEQFDDCMNRKKPYSVVTDGDRAMEQAIAKCMFRDYLIDEFEKKWAEIIEEYGLQEISLNASVKRYVDSSNTLAEFFEQFQR
ncbi:Protein FAR1-related sequence 5 [Senna tora]|uniref:Protein FAR1-related sequence 5 n=1 Tax=Senna tora TaxID=362788 RepID=A0A834SV36_9FABA|nr:Protein FAR1-related sequence 5 [Senna tora]